MADNYDENVNECTHDCSTCSANCSSREMTAEDFRATLPMGASVKHVYAVMSGKGGVGKSMVTSLLAAKFMQKGKRAAILDADITGPSIGHAFGLDGDVALEVVADELDFLHVARENHFADLGPFHLLRRGAL